MNGRSTELLCATCLFAASLVSCHHSTGVVAGNSPPAPSAPEVQIDPSTVAGFSDMKIFNADMLTHAKAGPVQTFPPPPPNLLGGGPVTFAAYDKWLSEVADAVSQGTDPSQ